MVNYLGFMFLHVHSFQLNYALQWNPSITDTIGNQHIVCYSKVCLTWGQVGMVLRNPAVKYNVAAFSELSFAVHWQRRLRRG